MELEPTVLLEQATRLRLDNLAVQASRCLAHAGIDHLLLKGPTTASWLYDNVRRYRDVDLLVRPSQAPKATEALASADVARPSGGAAGEEAHHAQLLCTPHGFELDLHIALPSTPVPRPEGEDAYWAVLIRHSENYPLLGELVPSLDAPGRCLVVALHALAARPDSQAINDLHRARQIMPETLWHEALAMATDLGVHQQAQAALDFVDGGDDASGLPLEFRLLAQGAPGAYQLRRLARAPRRDVPRLLAEEIFPSRGFMLRRYPEATGPLRLALAYADRLRLILSALPGQLIVLLRESRRG